jgi:biopolymer transport protein ExbD
MPIGAKRHTKVGAEIPTASMADIAFLLLVFFLATTTMISERGIGMVLPKWSGAEDPPPVKIQSERLIKVWINQYNRVAVDFEEVPIDRIAEVVRDRLIADTEDDDIVSLKTAPTAEYNTMVKVLDQIEEAYDRLPPGIARTKRVSLAAPGVMTTNGNGG